VANLAVAVRKGIEPAPSLAHEAFEVAQWASQSSAAAAIQLVSTSSSPVVDRSRKAAFASREAAFPSIFDPSPVVDRSRKAAFASPFPSIFVPQSLSYIAEAILDRLRGQPLMAEEVQTLLGANEALVFFLVGANESYVFALTREGFEWRTISLGEEDVSAKVAAFRRGLDIDELTKSVSMGKAQLFDLAAAHELYVALFGPIEALIKDKPLLLIVPSGPLTALPFHLLVTDKLQMQINDMAAYRDAAWLVKRHAATVLPSVASVKALRVFARKGQGTKPMIGFGDPVFAPDQAAVPADSTEKMASRTRAYSDYWHGGSRGRKHHG